MGRTGASEMFLATLDEAISNDVLNTLYEANIQITTTSKIKHSIYSNNNRVMDFEQLIAVCKLHVNQWQNFNYSIEQKNQIRENINTQIARYTNKPFVLRHYEQRLDNLI